MQTLALNLSKLLVKVFIIGAAIGFGFSCFWYVLNVPSEIGTYGTPVISGLIFFTKLKQWATC